MKKTRNPKKASPPFKIQGALTIYEVSDLHHRLLNHLKKNDRILLELEQVTDCDTAGLQFLYSVLKTARIQGKSFTLKTIPVPVKEAAERAGIDLGPFCMDR